MTYVINNLEWTISYVLGFNDTDGTETFGECHYKDLEIQLLQGMSYEIKRRTLIHEVTHAFIFSYGLDSCEMDEEFICRFMEAHAQKILETVDGIMNTSRG